MQEILLTDKEEWSQKQLEGNLDQAVGLIPVKGDQRIGDPLENLELQCSFEKV